MEEPTKRANPINDPHKYIDLISTGPLLLLKCSVSQQTHHQIPTLSLCLSLPEDLCRGVLQSMA